jgi:hypothetical protein
MASREDPHWRGYCWPARKKLILLLGRGDSGWASETRLRRGEAVATMKREDMALQRGGGKWKRDIR